MTCAHPTLGGQCWSPSWPFLFPAQPCCPRPPSRVAPPTRGRPPVSTAPLSSAPAPPGRLADASLSIRLSAGHRVRVRGRAPPALLRQPLPERPHLLQLVEAARGCGPAQVRGGGGGRGRAGPARGGHHAERRVRARRPRRPDSAHRLLVLRVSGADPAATLVKTITSGNWAPAWV